MLRLAILRVDCANGWQCVCVSGIQGVCTASPEKQNMCSSSNTLAHTLLSGAGATAHTWAEMTPAAGQVVASVSPPLAASPRLDNVSVLQSDTSSVHYTVSFLLTTAGYWRTAVLAPTFPPALSISPNPGACIR